MSTNSTGPHRFSLVPGLSTDNKYLFSGSHDHTIQQWAVGNEPVVGGTVKSLRTLQGHTSPVYCLALSTDNKYLFSGSGDHTIRQWAIGNQPESPTGHTSGTGEALRIMKGHSSWVSVLALSSDNKYLYPSGDETICQWAVGDETVGASVKLLRILQGHTGCVLTLSLSPDNKYLYSGAGDQTIRQWSTEDQNMLSNLFYQAKSQITEILCTTHDLFFTQCKDIWRIQLKSYQDGFGCGSDF